MIGRRALLTLAVALGLVAALASWLDDRRVPLLVAARDLDAETIVAGDDLATMDVPPAAVPEGAIVDPADAIGRTLHARLAARQLVLRAAFDAPAGFRSGLRPPSGWRAVALPVSPALALGGAVTPGVRVDVVAVPVNGRAPADRGPERLATGVLVLDVRSDAGGAFAEPGAATASGAAVNARLGSVVVAVPADDDLRFADRIATSTFILFRSR